MLLKLSERVGKDHLVRLYFHERKSISDIAKVLGCGYGSVQRLLNHYSIPKRTSAEGLAVFFAKNLAFNLSFFKVESPDFYYILGLWASDGCVYNGNRLSLSMTDKSVIEWVAERISYANPIKSYKPKRGKRYYVITLSSAELVEIFARYGIGERKSLTLVFPDNIPDIYVPHFVRGVFDGDGSVSKGKRSDNNAPTQTISIVSGSEKFIHELCGVIKNNLGISKEPTRYDNCYYFRTSHRREVLLFGDWIYQRGYFGMPRKREIFDAIRGREVKAA